MFDNANLLLKQAKNVDTEKFPNNVYRKHYLHSLSLKMQEEETELMELKRKIDDKIWELRHEESKVCHEWLKIK